MADAHGGFNDEMTTVSRTRPVRRAVAGAGATSTILVCFGLGAAADAAESTLYVDQKSPSCSDTGPGTNVQPYCSIGAAAKTAVAGQTVQVATGTYVESVVPARSGTESAPIVYTAAPGASVTVTGSTYGFKLSSRSYVTVTGFTVTRTTGHGIYVSGGAFDRIVGNHVSYAGEPSVDHTKRGIYVSGNRDSLVEDNTVDHNSEAGIYLTSTATGITVRGNVAFANARQYTRAAPGIDVRGTNNTILNNVSHDNEDSGLQFYTGARGNLVMDNLCYDNGDHGIDNLNAPDQVITGNTVFHNVTAGINLEGSSTGGTVRNNISVDNGINSPRTKSNIRVDANSVQGTTLDSNLTYLSQSSVDYIWGGKYYYSVAALRTATGQEQHGIQADPLFANLAARDFRLSSGSPAIDSADSSASGQQLTDLLGAGRVDDPATTNTGIGPRAYDDRGAYEYQG